MRVKLSAVAVIVCVFAFTPQPTPGKAWKGIVPLHSTRTDVEKLLGPPTIEDSGYDIDGQQVQISYSSQGCQDGLPGGWNVPSNTVVNLTISAKGELKLADVLISGKNYDEIYAIHTPRVDYVDVHEGLRYATLDGSVLSTTYFGSEADDQKLRCGEYKYAGPVPAGAKHKFEQYPFDSYGKIPFEDAEARLDSFEIQLRSLNEGAPRYRGFIIVYAGRSSQAAEASTIAACSRSYLISERNTPPDNLIATDGGYRDEFTVELYIMPDDAYPPQLMPTVSPKKIEILEGRLSPCPIR